MFINLLFMIMFFFSFMMFFKYYGHMLLTLIGLEYLVSMVLLNMYVYLIYYCLEFYLIYFLVVIVCESILGMVLLVSLIRYHGFDNNKIISINSW